jgi:hypothetical protein
VECAAAINAHHATIKCVGVCVLPHLCAMVLIALSGACGPTRNVWARWKRSVRDADEMCRAPNEGGHSLRIVSCVIYGAMHYMALLRLLITTPTAY